MEKLIKKFENKIYTNALWDSDERLKASKESAEYCAEECKRIALYFADYYKIWYFNANYETESFTDEELFDMFIEEYYKDEQKIK
jgi:hypothetical protein